MPSASAQTDPPISPSLLDRLVLQWRRDAPAAGIGAHLRRRQGHSLEFREYRAWQRGDDIRAVDWRISARQARPEDLLMRSFEAEEQMALAVLIDNRPEMALPEAMPRLLYALWAARALAHLALQKGDQVVLARLFRGPAEPVLRLNGGVGAARARSWTESLWEGRAESTTEFANPRKILEELRPAGAVVVISDMLFDDPRRLFHRLARQAQGKRRSLSVLQLDSTHHEIELLRRAARFRLLRPGQAADDTINEFEETAFKTATDAVAAHLGGLRRAVQAGGLDWPADPVSWPEPPDGAGPDGAELLKAHFGSTFPRLRMLAGLSLGGRT